MRVAGLRMRCCFARPARAANSWFLSSPAYCLGQDSFLHDVRRYYIILVDNIGHEISKPSDGMHAHFPQYDYDDMVGLLPVAGKRMSVTPHFGNIRWDAYILDLGAKLIPTLWMR